MKFGKRQDVRMKEKNYKAIAEIIKDTDVIPERVGKQGYNISKEDIAFYKGVHSAVTKIKSKLADYFEREDIKQQNKKLHLYKLTYSEDEFRKFNKKQFLKDAGVE